MRILNRYIRSAVISSTVIVLLVLLGFESLVEFTGQSGKIGVGHYDVYKAFIYVLTQLPSDLYQLFPMAGFLGCLIGLGRLASSSQLIVMRSAGISIARIAGSVIKAALLMIVVATFVGEFVAPKLQAKGNMIRATSLSSLKAFNGGWLRSANAYVYIGAVDSSHEISDVTRFVFNSKHQMLSAAHAKKGIFSHGQWQLLDVRQSQFTPDRVKVVQLATLPLKVVFNPVLWEASNKGVDQQSVVGLYHTIQYREHAQLETRQYKFAFWQRIMQPLTTIVMICLGVPFIFGSLRSASMGLRVLTGVIVGFVFYMLNQFFGPFTMVYEIPPVLAAMMPTVLFAVACVILLRRSKV